MQILHLCTFLLLIGLDFFRIFLIFLLIFFAEAQGREEEEEASKRKFGGVRR
jgi:hypothetical protein